MLTGLDVPQEVQSLYLVQTVNLLLFHTKITGKHGISAIESILYKD